MSDITDYPVEDREAVAGYLRDRATKMNRAHQEDGAAYLGRRAEMLERLADEVEPE